MLLVKIGKTAQHFVTLQAFQHYYLELLQNEKKRKNQATFVALPNFLELA
jgi:hypothetical protein